MDMRDLRRLPRPSALALAADLGRRGRHDEAGSLCLDVLRQDGADGDTLVLLGLSRLEGGHADAALAALHRAVALEPGSAAPLGSLAVTLTRSGRPEAGFRAFQRAALLAPLDATAHINLARALVRRSEHARARVVLERAVERIPLDGPLLYELARLLHESGATGEAEVRYLAAAAVEPQEARAWVGIGALYAATGRSVAAAKAYHQAIRRRPLDAALHAQRVTSLGAAGERAAAHAAALRALVLEPERAGRYRVAAETAVHDARFAAAAALYRRAVLIEPDCAATANNICGALNDLGRFAEAERFARRALALEPGMPEAWGSLANAHENQDDPTAAITGHRRALRIRPDFQSSHWNMALCLLRLGDFEAGWRAYEWRLDPRVKPDAFRLPRWTGERYDGRTLLLCGEQGHGDVLQFLRYVPEAARRGGRVVLELQPGLVRLARSVLPGVAVYPLGQVRVRCDLQAYLLSLPHLFGTTLDTVPRDIPYLHPAPDAAAAWARRLAGESRLKVGLVWAGEPRLDTPRSHLIDRRRSMPAAAYERLATVPGVAFLSLQKGFGAGQRPPEALRMTDWMAEVGDFADTAALVFGLDLVITVDTSMAHLAGALGKPVWVLSRFDACWRWLGHRADSPWYPTMRLFHQRRPGDWAEVVERVAAELAVAAAGDRTRLRPPPGSVGP